ncbi:MAG: helix-turn-helix domain-containing protein [Spirochaetaceae bacterium]|nr:helix-turn-helix domain-containing protein [Spirochaetaceae bacterium]
MDKIKPVVLDRGACYAALSAHDARFDGKFFAGVSSTGIYCRPVCRVKRPKAENCSYYPSAAAAEAGGYRPCLKCRPELAPGLSPADAAARLARKAAFIISHDCPEENTLAELAGRLGISGRHLRRVFNAEYGVSPVRYVQTCRLLLAKNLLTDTNLSITESAMTAGFGSLRRFNDLFKKQYRLTPGDIRKQDKHFSEKDKSGITLFPAYRPPYEWDKLIKFFSDRALPGIEEVRGGVYRRTAALQNRDGLHRGWISVMNVPAKNALAVTLSRSLLPVLPKVLARIKILFDTDCSPLEIYEKLSGMNRIRAGLCAAGTRLPGSFDPFEMAVRAVLGQQITVKAAGTLAARFVAAFGEKLTSPFDDLFYTFPGPETIYHLEGPVENHLGPLGITGARARSIYALAEALVKGRISLTPEADSEAEMKKLMSLPGFGPWTVNYIGMRALSWPDAFPHTDYGIKKALGGKPAEEILALAEHWRPWRSYAAVDLWNSLEVL